MVVKLGGKGMEVLLEKIIDLLEVITKGDIGLQLGLLSIFLIFLFTVRTIKHQRVRYLQIIFSNNMQIESEMNKNMFIAVVTIFLAIFVAGIASVLLHSDTLLQERCVKRYYAYILFLVLVIQIIMQRKKSVLNGLKEFIMFFIPIVAIYIIMAMVLMLGIESSTLATVTVSLIVILLYILSSLYFSPMECIPIQYVRIYVKNSNNTYTTCNRDVIYRGDYVIVKYRNNNKVTRMVQINREDIEKIHYYA